MGWLLFIPVLSLFYHPNISAAEKNLLTLTRSGTSEYVKSLQFEKHESYDAASLFLLNRKLLQSDEIPKTEAVLQSLEQSVDWSVEPIIAVERINVYLKKGDRAGLLRYLVKLAESVEASLYEDKIFRILTEQYIGYPEQKSVGIALKKLLPLYEGWRQNPEFILWALGILTVNDIEYSHLVLQLWSVMDASKFPLLFNSNLVVLKKNLVEHQEIIARHFSSQYRLKNWTYIIAEAAFYLKRLPPDRAEFLKIREIYIKSYFRKRHYSQLIQKLNSRESSKVFSFTREEKAGLLFRLWLKKGQLNKAAEYLKLLEKISTDKMLADRYFEFAEYQFERNQYRKSLQYYDRIKAGTATPDLIEVVQWRKLRIHDKLKQRQELAKVAAWADNFDFQSREVAAKFCFWGMKLKLYAGRSAESCYERYPLTYYGFRSLSLGRTQTNIAAKILAEPELKKTSEMSRSEQSFLNFIHVLYLSQETEIADVLVLRYLKKHINTKLFTRLMDVLFKAERYYLQQQLVDYHFGESFRKNGGEYRPFLMAYYPAGYRKEVIRHIGQSNIPQMLVYAVIREESNFRAEVESPAGAVGLMQLMPSTAKYLAKIMKTTYKPDQLIHPDFNVRLGVTYLKRLLRRYKGNLFYTLAAYNGGATNVKRWVRKVPTKDFDVFVESISFIETQNYVKRVIRSYYIYQMLYGQKIQMDNPDSISLYPGWMPTAASQANGTSG